jgi:hypothetical protein
VEGGSAQQTVLNILAAIHDSKDTRHYHLVNADVDPGNDQRIRISSVVTGNVLEGKAFPFMPLDVAVATDTITLNSHGFVNFMRVQIDTTGSLPNGITAATDYFVVNTTANTFQLATTLNVGEVPTSLVDITTIGTGIHSVIPTGNLFPIYHAETTGFGDTINFLVTPMSLAISTTLIDPAYPVPPVLGTFTLPDGRIELPSSTSVSFVMRIPDGVIGMNAYGEIGIWVEVLQSHHPMEIGRKVLFAVGHFPILCKTDRTLLTFRVIIAY